MLEGNGSFMQPSKKRKINDLICNFSVNQNNITLIYTSYCPNSNEFLCSRYLFLDGLEVDTIFAHLTAFFEVSRVVNQIIFYRKSHKFWPKSKFWATLLP